MADSTKPTTTTTTTSATAPTAAKGPSARSSLSDEEMRARLTAARAGARTEAAEEKGNRFVEAIKTFLWVAPLTALIWIYAEREQIAVLTDVPVTLAARSARPDRIVTIVSPEDRRAYLNLEGPRASLDRVRDRLSDPRRPIELTVPEELQPGTEGEVAVTERISNHDVFRGSAVKVSRARPAIRVRVEQKVSRAVPVRASPQAKIVGEVTFEPEAVTVEGPASLFGRIPAEEMVVSADLSRFAARPPGKYEDEVPLTFRFDGENVSRPKTVKVKVDVRQSRVVELPAIPIHVQLPALVLGQDRYKVTTSSPTLANVEVTGPPDAIESIQRGKFPAAAILEVSPEDLQSPGLDKVKRLTPANYRMPPGVTVTRAERDVTYSVSER